MAESTARAARAAFEHSQALSHADRVEALRAIEEALKASKAEILEANAKDVTEASKLAQEGKMDPAIVKRLDLQSSADKFDSMVQGISDVANLPDPAGQVSYASQLDDDLQLCRVSCPIGTLLCIFEARPEVMMNISALAIKSGNAAVLKGGKESLQSQAVLTRVLQSALSKTQLPSTYIQTVESRSDIAALLEEEAYIDLVIPRGSNSLVKSIKNATKIPVLGHADGICAVFLDESADVRKAVRVVVDSKTSYPAACNAVETLLVHQSVLSTVWPAVASALLQARVSLRCDETSLAALPSDLKTQQRDPAVTVSPSSAEDYRTEFLSLMLAVQVVPSLEAAISHINAHSSHHTDAIVTEDDSHARAFCKQIDSAGVYVNAATRFADGFRYGFGTEVGVSTSKTHARGPVGLEGLMIYKYIVKGTGAEGHATADYSATGGKKFKHKRLQLKEAPF